jgi:hypothetical protein
VSTPERRVRSGLPDVNAAGRSGFCHRLGGAGFEAVKPALRHRPDPSGVLCG